MRILVHICCGPCAITVLQGFADAGHSLTGFFFNPNIHPLAENLRRREGALNVAEKLGISMIMPDSALLSERSWHSDESLKEMGITPLGVPINDTSKQGNAPVVPDATMNAVQGSAPASLNVPDAVNPVPWLRIMAGREQNRCDACWRMRIFYTAQQAKVNGFEAFSSSLSFSRHQNHATLRALGEEAATAYGLAFVYEDFRPTWQRGVALSKEWGIYRQQYCGCVYSEYERYARDCAQQCAAQ